MISASTSGSSRPQTATVSPMPAKDPKTNLMPTDNFTEKEISDLLKLGFPRVNVIAELRAASGDVTKATAALFAKSLKF